MGRGEPPRDLPAPYEDPWGLLRRDLVAVAASLRLRLWELARRNRQGELPRPGFWPQGLAAWFWPLLLVLPVLLLTLAITLLRPHPQPPQAGAAAEVGSQAGSPLEAPLAASLQAPLVAPVTPAQAPVPAPALPRPSEPAPVPPLPPELLEGDPQHLIRTLRTQPAAARLELELDPRFLGQPPQARQQQAEAWLAAAERLGYEQLLLLDGQGRLLGRRARVGSGMILFASPVDP